MFSLQKLLSLIVTARLDFNIQKPTDEIASQLTELEASEEIELESSELEDPKEDMISEGKDWP